MIAHAGMLDPLKTLKLAARSHALRPSPTLAMGAKARKMREAGRRVVSFAAGEPDFGTPKEVCDEAIRALQDGETKYTPSSGTSQLRAAIAEKFVQENGLDATPENVMATCGAKQALFNAFNVLLDPGDEAIVLAPCWPTYLDQLQVAGAQAVPVRCDDLKALEAAITPQTRMVIVNSPCNPTGGTLHSDYLTQLGKLADRHGLWLVSDEIYERLRYEGRHESTAKFCDPERCVTVSGCSKSYAMTGWRIGFAHGPTEVIRAMGCVQDQVTSNPTTFAQAGAVAALHLPQKVVDDMRETFRRRRDLMVQSLGDGLGIEVPVPNGAFYVMLDLRSLLKPGETDVEFADSLLEASGVATVPGSFFLADGSVRLSYATSEHDIVSGTALMASFVKDR